LEIEVQENILDQIEELGYCVKIKEKLENHRYKFVINEIGQNYFQKITGSKYALLDYLQKKNKEKYNY